MTSRMQYETGRNEKEGERMYIVEALHIMQTLVALSVDQSVQQSCVLPAHLQVMEMAGSCTFLFSLK